MKSCGRLYCGFIILLLFHCHYSLLQASEQMGEKNTGIVIISHGAPVQNWNNQVLKLIASVKSPYPLETAFLDFNEDMTLEKAVKKLEGKGVDEIAIVHLSPSSYSIHHEEIKYLVGLRKGLGFYTEEADPPIKSNIKRFVVSNCMDDHPLAIQILTDYARELSHNPEEEALILVGHGPVEELMNIMWVRQLKHIGQEIEKELKFREIVCMTLRNDSADVIREQASLDLEEAAKRLSKQGKVIILIYALGDGALQMEMRHILRGIPSVIMSNRGVISHSKAKKWIEETIQRGMDQPQVPPVNRGWSHYDCETGKPKGTHQYGLL
jgi:sirohydrochlorin cobaltochelatase